MAELFNAIDSLYSIQIKFNGITVTFWHMFLFFAVLALGVWIVKNVFL